MNRISAEQLYSLLSIFANQRQLITYGALAPIAGFQNALSLATSGILNEVNQLSIDRKEVLLSVLVVNKTRFRPGGEEGRGFYENACHHIEAYLAMPNNEKTDIFIFGDALSKVFQAFAE